MGEPLDEPLTIWNAFVPDTTIQLGMGGLLTMWLGTGGWVHCLRHEIDNDQIAFSIALMRIRGMMVETFGEDATAETFTAVARLSKPPVQVIDGGVV